MEGEMNGGMCKCPHHKFVPALVVLFALLFLLGNLGVVNQQTVNIVWPILVGLVGLKKLGVGSCRCC